MSMSMSDPADIVASIHRLITAINGTCAFIQAVEEPPQDAEDVKNVLVTAKAKLSALQTRIMTQARGDEFSRKWGEPAQKVLDYMRLSIGKINSRLKVNVSSVAAGGSVTAPLDGSLDVQPGQYRLSRFTGKPLNPAGPQWPYTAEETAALQKEMEYYAGMLTIVNNSFLS
jgi:hypothetical protein